MSEVTKTDVVDGIIDYKIKDHVATITINRSRKMNSITKDMAIALQDVAKNCNEDKDVRVVILTGEGVKSFSTGSDINLIHQYGTPFELKNRLDYCSAIRSIRKPVISKVKGYALGGGFELCLATDIRIVSDTAKFAASEVKHGWISGSGLTQILARNIGYPRAAELVLTGDMIDAKRAYDLGIINHIIPMDDIDTYVEELANRMTKLSPIATQLAKENLVASQNMTLETGLKFENDLFAFSFTTEDSAEGLLAFKEKREPDFS